MKGIKLTLIILISLTTLILLSNISTADMNVYDIQGVDQWVQISDSGDPYRQQFKITNSDIKQLTGVSLYIDKSECSGFIIGGIIADPAPLPNNIVSDDYIASFMTPVLSNVDDGWNKFSFHDDISRDNDNDAYINVTSGETYHIILEYIGTGYYTIALNSQGGIPADWEFKQKDLGNAWKSYEGNVNLTFKLWGKKYNLSTGDTNWVHREQAYVDINLDYDANESTEIGYWLDTNSTDSSNYWINVSGGSFSAGEISAYTPANLTEAEYYYLRPWANNTWGFINTTDEITFLTKPNKPTGLTVTGTNSTNISLSWTNAAVGYGTNRTTVISYDTDNYPTIPSEGTIAYNGTGTSTTIESLEHLETYYISAFTYVNCSGSPYYWWYSELYSYTDTTTSGGEYNVTVRWECNDTLVNLSAGNYYFIAETVDGYIQNETQVTNENGLINFSTAELPVCKIITNSTTGDINEDSAIRSVLMDPTDNNMTIYLPCGEVGTDYGDTSLVTIFFNDYTGSFTEENNALAYLYKYNGTTKEYIHMDFVQADISIRPYVTIGEIYYLGVGCNSFSKTNIGKITIAKANDQIIVDVMDSDQDIQKKWTDISKVKAGWADDIIYFDFEDKSKLGTMGVENSTIRLYYASNNTLINLSYEDPAWEFNYTYVGLNTSHDYKIIMGVVYNGSTYVWYGNFSYIILAKTYDTIIDDPDEINNDITNLFGLSPVRLSTTQVVAYTSLVAALISIFVLFTFSKAYSGFAIMAVGVVLGIFKGPLNLITNDVVNWVIVSVLIILGILVIFASKNKWR